MAKTDNSENKLLIIPTSVLRKLYSHDAWDDEKKKTSKTSLVGTDAVQLYTFLYFTSNWQNGVGNQPEATNSYCMRHFKWGKLRYLAAEKVLKAEGLIEKIRKVDARGQVIGWFVRLPFKASVQTENDIETRSSVENHWSTKTRGSADHQVAGRTTNTNSTNKLNTNSTNIKNTPLNPPQGEELEKREDINTDTNTYPSAKNSKIGPTLDNVKPNKKVTFEEITEPPLTQDELQFIYDKITDGDESFDEYLGNEDGYFIYDIQKQKTALHFKSKNIKLKTREQFLYAIASYTLSGGIEPIKKIWKDDQLW